MRRDPAHVPLVCFARYALGGDVPDSLLPVVTPKRELFSVIPRAGTSGVEEHEREILVVGSTIEVAV
jgi:hypothetical protein